MLDKRVFKGFFRALEFCVYNSRNSRSSVSPVITTKKDSWSPKQKYLISHTSVPKTIANLQILYQLERQQTHKQYVRHKIYSRSKQN